MDHNSYHTILQFSSYRTLATQVTKVTSVTQVK